jgi:hypothetical protein
MRLLRCLARISQTHRASIALWGGDPAVRGLPPRLDALAKAAKQAVVRHNATHSGGEKMATHCVAVVAKAASLGGLRRLMCRHFFLRADVMGLRNPG